jgi:chemotaxis protein CheD
VTVAVAPTRHRTAVAIRRVEATPVRVPSLPATYVHPGQIVVSGGHEGFTTILGSCVSVCLHDPKLGLGGLNHFLLPMACPPEQMPGRYGPTAMSQLLNAMLANGAVQQRLVAHVVGGASVLAAFGSDGNHLGMRNVTVARDFLAAHRIPVLSIDVGGTRGRKLIFTPRDGLTYINLIGG